MPVRIASVVEGDGEVESLPILIRRVLQSEDVSFWAETKPPIRRPRDKVVKSGELERAMALAALQVESRGALLVVLDSDDDAPCELGPKLLERALKAGLDLPVAVTLAHKEWECWYLGAAKSISGQRGLRPALSPPSNPEGIRGAKEWLRNNMQRGSKYAPALDQPKLAASFSLEEAMVCPSFVRFRRELLQTRGGGGRNLSLA